MFALLPATLEGAETTTLPNILWITAEDMSPALGCWGDEYALTPNIDRLASQGVRYTNTFATAPVCSPARSCIITGVYATSLGTQRLRSGFPIPESIHGFPSFLRAAGYYCTNNVKTDYNTGDAERIIAESWSDCSDTAHWRGKQAGQPFFSVFNDMTSHQSRTMVWPYEQFKTEVQSRLGPDEIHDPALAPVPPYYPDTPVVRRTVARFYDCVTVMDQNVGRLLRQLEEDGLAEDTIVFFYSDHGSGIPRHKRLLLDSGMHVPLIVRFPEKFRHLAPAGAGAKQDRLVSFVDLAPTVLSLCRQAIPGYMQGTAFLGPDSGPPRELVYGARDRVDEVFDLARSVRDKRFLYIRNYMPHLAYNQPSSYSDQSEIRHEFYRVAGVGRMSGALLHYAGPTRAMEELYDCREDPMNLRNLASDPAMKGTLARLREAQVRWSERTGDLGFLPEVEAWKRSVGGTPYSISGDPGKHPQPRLMETAALVGQGVGVLPQLVSRLQDPDPAVRYWAAVGLSALGDLALTASDPLSRALADPSITVRIEAAGALCHMGLGAQGLPVLVEALRDPDADAVLHACRTVEQLGDRAQAAIPAVQAALALARAGTGDRNMFIQFSAEAFLARVNDL